MLRSSKLILLFAVLVTALASCQRSEPPQVKTLPGGREIKIVSMKLGHLENGGRGIYMVYETQIPFDRKAALMSEMSEAFAAIQSTATRDRYVRYVSITAQSPPKGFVLARRESVEITLHQQPDGSWKASKP
jgi:hypothetical protein